MKQTLGWSTPRFRHPEQADRWTWLVLAAYAQLRLARVWAADGRLPWERPQRPRRLTPTRVPRGFRDTPGGRGHPGEASETPWEIPRTSEGQPLGTGQASSGAQNERLSKPEKPVILLRAPFRSSQTADSA